MAEEEEDEGVTIKINRSRNYKSYDTSNGEETSV